MSALAALPTALAATHVFGALDFASHCRLARVDRRHRAIAQLAQASPVELPVASEMPASVWQRPGLRPRRIILDCDRISADPVDVDDGPRQAASLAAVCARVDTLHLPDTRDPLLLACATHLKTLRLDYVWDDQWRQVVATCSALTDLDVFRAAPLSIDLTQHPPPASLLALRFAATSLSSSELRALSVACPRLAFLEFTCPRFVECVGDFEFPHLTRLEILCGEWTDYGAPANPAPWRLTVASFPRLARLQLTGNGVDAYRALSVLTALEVLDARHSRTDRVEEYVEDEADKTTGVSSTATIAETSEPLSSTPAACCWPRLKSLAVSTVADIRGIPFPFATLTELYVSPWNSDDGNADGSRGYGVLDVAVAALVRKMPTLRHLTLSRYGVRSSASSLTRNQTPIPARIDARFTAAWNAVLGSVLTAASSKVGTVTVATASESRSTVDAGARPADARDTLHGCGPRRTWRAFSRPRSHARDLFARVCVAVVRRLDGRRLAGRRRHRHHHHHQHQHPR